MQNKCFSIRKFLSFDVCILFIRIFTVSLLFYKHGYEKAFGFQEMLINFPDPIGIGKLLSLTFASIADSVCTVLIAIGLFSRVATSIVMINLIVAFFAFHHGEMNDHGEAMILYMVNMFFLFLSGAGKFSLDSQLSKFSFSE